MSPDGGVRPPVGGTTEPEKPRPGGDAAGLEHPPSPAAKPDLVEIEATWLRMCAACDAGLAASCTCSYADPRLVVADLIAEIERLRAAIETAAADLDGDRLIFAWRAAQRIRQTLNEETKP